MQTRSAPISHIASRIYRTGIRKFEANQRSRKLTCNGKVRCTQSLCSASMKTSIFESKWHEKIAFFFRNHSRRTRSTGIQNPIVHIKCKAVVSVRPLAAHCMRKKNERETISLQINFTWRRLQRFDALATAF